jgi:hypothetical protein
LTGKTFDLRGTAKFAGFVRKNSHRPAGVTIEGIGPKNSDLPVVGKIEGFVREKRPRLTESADRVLMVPGQELEQFNAR